ncbi:MAG: DUF2497 domain-containing protein [Rhodospirillales bacterium]|nr:DUF2497 domain-containing protein [Rhodospirillales bacterium]
MSNQKPDLSKQQILESIGRIVADGEGRESGPDESAPPDAEPAPATAEDDDILDLVDMVDEQGDLIHLDREREGESEIAEDGRPSEEQVLETLRPMLQTWLDTHMPPMVERLVKRELERAPDRPEPE